MKRSVIVASLLLNALASDAFAATWSANGDAKQSVDTSNNYFLQPLPVGYAGKALSAIDLDFLAATPTTQYRLDTNYSYYQYFGPGDVSQKLLWGTPAGAKFSYNYQGALSKFTAGASWQRADVATTALEQIGQASGRGTVDTYAANSAWSYNLNRLDTISWTNNASTVSFSQGAGTTSGISAQTPYFDYVTTGAWTHLLSPTTRFTDTFKFNWHSTDDAAKSQRLLWDLQSSLISQLTRRLTLNASVSGTFLDAYEKNPSAAPSAGLFAPTGFNVTSGTQLAVQWSAEVQYLLSNTTRASLSAANVVTPTIFGQLQQTDSIGFTINHNINHSSALTFLTELTRSKSSGTSTQFITTALKYEYRLPRNWLTEVTLTYRQRDQMAATSGSTAAISGSTTATSAEILVSLRYDFNLYGKPAPRPTALVTAGQLTRSGFASPNLSSDHPLGLQPGTGLTPEQQYNPEQQTPEYNPEQPEYNPEQPEYNPETAPDYPERQPEYNPEQPGPTPPTTASPQD